MRIKSVHYCEVDIYTQVSCALANMKCASVCLGSAHSCLFPSLLDSLHPGEELVDCEAGSLALHPRLLHQHLPLELLWRDKGQISFELISVDR